MKNIILFIAVILIYFTKCYGQESKLAIGVNLSPSITKVRSSLLSFHKTIGYGALVNVEYFFNDKFSINIDLGLERKGTTIENFGFVDIHNEVHRSDFIFNSNYFIFPIYGSLRNKGKIKVIFDFGLNFGVLINETINLKSNINYDLDYDPLDFYYVTFGGFKRFDLGLYTGLSLGFPISDKLSIITGLRSSYGIINAFQLPLKSQSKMGVLGLKLGIAYKL